MNESGQIRVLLVEDNPGDARLIQEMLSETREVAIDLVHADRLSAALKCLDAGETDLVLLDLSLPDGRGLDAYNKVQSHAKQVPVVVLTGLDDETMAASTLQEGAQDYLVKGQIDSALLVRAIRYAIDRNRAEEERRETEARFRLLFERSGDAIFLVDRRTGRYLDGNAAAERLTGRSSAELTSLASDAELPMAAVRRLGQLSVVEDAMDPGEVTFVRPDGARRTALLSSINLSDDLSFAIAQDITERKEAEETLRESELKFRSLAEQAPSMIFISRDDRLVYANARCEGLTGYRPDEIVRSDFGVLSLVDAGQHEEIGRSFRRAASGEDVPTMECRLVTRSGDRVEVQLAVRRIEYEGGTAMLGVVTDITEHNRMQRGLTESQRRFGDLVNLLPQGVWETDLEGDFTFMNRQGLEDLGYSETDTDGPRNAVEAFAPEDRDRLREDIRRALAGEKLGATEYTALRKDGSRFPVLVHSAAIVRDGERVGLRGVTADITELNKTQLQLRHSQLLASLGEMTAGIVHEVNNPLGSVLLYAELLMAEEVSPRMRKDLQIIHEEVKRAAKIMSDLLTYGRSVRSPAQDLDLHQVIGKVVDMREYLQRVSNVTLTASFQEGVLPVRGDAGQLTQVFMNLILNAEEALKEAGGGHITVSTWTDGPWAKASVADDGPGIPPENLSQVFFPFFTTKGVGEGTGLGLSTCYGIVTSHRGLIHAANGKLGGAIFTVELPLAKDADVAEPQEAAAGSAN